MSKFQGSKPQGKVNRAGPRSKKDEQEFGLAKKEFVLCSECGCAYFEKSWHRNIEEDIKHFKEGKKLQFELCPACKMKKDKRYEGELVIRLSDTKRQEEVLNEIKNSDKMAQERDPMDRVLWIDKKDSEIRVFTSENQLAVKIGKKLKSSFGKGELKINHSTGEDVIRVYFEL